MTQSFFQTVQNKMHWAVHGQTAAEVIHRRANATQPHMGLTSWKGAKVRKPDVAIAKNYLTGEELKKLSLIVTQYLDFAELQALERRPMTMRDWIAKLDVSYAPATGKSWGTPGAFPPTKRSGRRNSNLTSSTGSAASWKTPKPTRSSPRKLRTWPRRQNN